MSSLKIGLMGYGRMGKEVESAALKRGHNIALKIDSHNSSSITPADLKVCDVIIEFTRPDTVLRNIDSCLDAGIPVVTGTTGWTDHLKTVTEKCIAVNGTFLFASNFSVGVNILFEMNRKLAALMSKRTEYDVRIEEVHHIHKLDKPSGTGITIANDIIASGTGKKDWSLDKESSQEKIFIDAIREGEVVGRHSIIYTSVTDEIMLVHNAFNRSGFAEGAVLAAEYISGRKGVYTMKDVLGITA